MIKLTFLPPVAESEIVSRREGAENRRGANSRLGRIKIARMFNGLVTGASGSVPVTILGMSQIAAIIAKHFREIPATQMLLIRLEGERPPHFFRSALQRELGKLCVHCVVYKRSESDYIIAHAR